MKLYNTTKQYQWHPTTAPAATINMTAKYEQVSANDLRVNITCTIDGVPDVAGVKYIASHAPAALREIANSADKIITLSRVGGGRGIGVCPDAAAVDMINQDVEDIEKYHDEYMRTQPYEYSVHNFDNFDDGFNKNDIVWAIKERAKKVFGDDLAFCAIDDCEDDVLKKLNKKFAARAEADYTPFPFSDAWTPEYRAAMEKNLKNNTAPGVAHIPAADVFAALDEIIKECGTPAIKEIRENAMQVINDAEKRGYYTDEEAEKKRKEWIKLQNEGGDGYVPHYITEREYGQVKKIISAIDKYLSK